MDTSQDLAQILARFKPVAGQPLIRFGLERMQKALAALEHPQARMPPSVHICGTNGKGSVAAFVRAIAESAGLRVHVYTSPHLITVNERIRLDRKPVSDQALAAALIRIADTQIDLSWFEALTVAAFCLFAEHSADLCVIETGAGGELDATNALSGAALCVVTPISLDHEAMFGVSGLAEIARVKSGIFRSRVPVVMAAQKREAQAVLLEQARCLSAPVWLQGRDWQAGLSPGFAFRMGRFELDCERLSLAGLHQATNAGLACAVWRLLCQAGILPCPLDRQHIAEGLAQAVWPARLQTLKDGAVTQGLGMPVILDGAHNPAAAEALAEEIARQAGEKALLTGIGPQKDMRGILEPLSKVVCKIIACPLPGREGVEPRQIAALLESSDIEAVAVDSLEAGLHQASQTGADRLYIAGSLYLAAAVLEANGENLQ